MLRPSCLACNRGWGVALGCRMRATRTRRIRRGAASATRPCAATPKGRGRPLRLRMSKFMSWEVRRFRRKAMRRTRANRLYHRRRPFAKALPSPDAGQRRAHLPRSSPRSPARRRSRCPRRTCRRRPARCRSMLSTLTPPSTSRRIGRPVRCCAMSTSLRAARSLSSACGMNDWPPKPGFTDMMSTRSSLSITCISQSSGVAGLNTSPALQRRTRG